MFENDLTNMIRVFEKPILPFKQLQEGFIDLAIAIFEKSNHEDSLIVALDDLLRTRDHVVDKYRMDCTTTIQIKNAPENSFYFTSGDHVYFAKEIAYKMAKTNMTFIKFPYGFIEFEQLCSKNVCIVDHFALHTTSLIRRVELFSILERYNMLNYSLVECKKPNETMEK